MQDRAILLLADANDGFWRMDHWDFHWAMGTHGLIWWASVVLIVVGVVALVRFALKPRDPGFDDETLRAIMEDRYGRRDRPVRAPRRDIKSES